MTSFEKRINYYVKKYRYLCNCLNRWNIKFPEGSLQVKNVKRGYEYFHYLDGKKKYLAKEEYDIVKGLVRKEYYNNIQTKLEKNLKLLERMQRNFREDELDAIYYNLHEGKKGFVDPIESTREMKLTSWLKQKYTKKEFRDDMIVIKSNNGIRVRSKSEKILADYFHEKGLVFQYEKPVYIDEFTTFHPDFTFLSLENNEEIYWEHFGMMDYPEYSNKVYDKILKYRERDIYVGVNLIITFENSKQFINMKEIDALINKFLLDKWF